MLLRSIMDVIALLIAFGLGVVFSTAVKGALGLLEEDLKVEVGLMRTDMARMSETIEKRLADIEERLSK
jgi:hypothetical protein